MSYSLEELAVRTASQLVGDPQTQISGVNTLDEAEPSDASFLANLRYAEAMKKSAAGVICVSSGISLIEGRNYLISDTPSRTFQQIVELLIPQRASGFQGIHPTAVIHPTASIGQNVLIGPYAVIDRGVLIGDETIIFAHVSISYEVQIGSCCRLHSSCVVRERCKLGSRVVLQPGAVIGSCGFGFIPDAKGRYHKLEQLGIVVLEDDVEIGANTTIDRSRFKETIIRRGSKIDNLCQIAHNVEIGEDNCIAAQTGLAGSSKTGKHVLLGGQVGVTGHVRLKDRAMVSSQSGVSKSLESGSYRGSPAIPLRDYQRREVYLRKIEEYANRIQKLEEACAAFFPEHAYTERKSEVTPVIASQALSVDKPLD